MNIKPINQNYTSNKTQKTQSFTARPSKQLEEFFEVLDKQFMSERQKFNFDHHFGKNIKKIERAKKGDFDPVISIEQDNTGDCQPNKFIVFADVSENIFGDAPFKFIKSQSGSQNASRLITAIKKAAESIKNYNPLPSAGKWDELA